MTELLTSWLSGLKNADHVGITKQIFETAQGTNISNETYKLAVATLSAAIQVEDDAYKRTQKDWAVEQLKSADVEMDNYMKAIRSILAGHAALPDGEPTKQKAKEILHLWKDYAFKLSDSYSGESSKIVNMYQEVEKEKAAAQEIGIWGYFEKARRKALEIQNLLNERFDDLASRTVGEMKKARALTDAAIKQYFQVVNSLQVLNSSDTVTELARKLRAIEDYARVYYLHIPSVGSGDLPATPPSTGGDEDDGPLIPPVGGM